MFRYAIYTRSNEGYIERKQNIISSRSYNPEGPYGYLTPYIHKEQLNGFPETVVFWAAPTGTTVGIAPLDNNLVTFVSLDKNHGAGRARFFSD